MGSTCDVMGGGIEWEEGRWHGGGNKLMCVQTHRQG